MRTYGLFWVFFGAIGCGESGMGGDVRCTIWRSFLCGLGRCILAARIVAAYLSFFLASTFSGSLSLFSPPLPSLSLFPSQMKKNLPPTRPHGSHEMAQEGAISGPANLADDKQTESAKEARKAFYCELCAKGYGRINDFEAHESSYDHLHKKVCLSNF